MTRDLQEVSDWLEAHPWWRRGITLWLVLAIFDLAEGLRLLLERLAR